MLLGGFLNWPAQAAQIENLNADNNGRMNKTSPLLDSFFNLKDIIAKIIQDNDYKTNEKEYERALYTFVAEACQAIGDSTIEELEKETDEISIFQQAIQSDIDIFIKNYKHMIFVRSEQGHTIPNDVKEMEEVVISDLLGEL